MAAVNAPPQPTTPYPKSMKTTPLFAALLLSPLLLQAEDVPAPIPVPAAPEAAAPAAVPPEAPPAEPRAAAFRKHVLEKFDADKDGQLSETEREAAKAAIKEKGSGLRAMALVKFDADKDGQLSETEREALKAAIKARRAGKGGDEKAGVKNAERHQKMLEKFDADKDGQLNESERAKAREARKARPVTTA